MNAVIIHPRFTGSFGGTKKVCLKFAESLESEGWSVDVYWEDGEKVDKINDVYDIEFGEKISFHKVSSMLPEFDSNRFYLLQNLVRLTEFKKIALREDREPNTDLIIFTAGMRDFDYSFETPTLQYLHRYWEEDWSQEPALYRWLLRKIFREGFLDADLNLCNSRYVSERLDIYNEVVYPSVDMDYCSVPWKERDDRAVIAGRIERDKNIEEAISICEETDLDLYIIGLKENPSYFNELHREVRKRDWVKILPDLSKKDYLQVIRESKVGLSCKREENFGITTLEYINNGLIPMVYANAGPEEIVGKKMFTYSSVVSASEKIQDNLENHQEALDYLQSRAKDFGSSRFRKEIIERIEDLSSKI